MKPDNRPSRVANINATQGVAITLLLTAGLIAFVGYQNHYQSLDTNLTLERLLQDFYANISTELASIAVTVLIIDGLNEKREQQRLLPAKRLLSRKLEKIVNAILISIYNNLHYDADPSRLKEGYRNLPNPKTIYELNSYIHIYSFCIDSFDIEEIKGYSQAIEDILDDIPFNLDPELIILILRLRDSMEEFIQKHSNPIPNGHLLPNVPRQITFRSNLSNVAVHAANIKKHINQYKPSPKEYRRSSWEELKARNAHFPLGVILEKPPTHIPCPECGNFLRRKDMRDHRQHWHNL